MSEADVLVSCSQFSSSVDENKFNLHDLSSRRRECCNIGEYYEVEKCVKCIKDKNFTKVALQFPDWQLCDAPVISKLLEKQTKCKIYILADTSYGSCCVDEIAAEHVNADLIIHFGPSCLSLTEHTPVLYIFGKESIDINSCCQSFQDQFPNKESKCLIIYEVIYNYAIDEIYSKLASEYKYIIRSYLNCESPENICLKETENNCNEEKDYCSEESNCCRKNNAGFQKQNKFGCFRKEVEELKELKDLEELSTGHCNTGLKYSRFGRTFTLAEFLTLEEFTIFYIGQENLTLTNHMMSYNKCQFITYNPESKICRLESLNVNRMLMKRYYLIEKAKDSCVVGILVGTLGIVNYISAIRRIKKLLCQAGKKYYTFVIGKLNAEKMANFMEIDIFVLVACPENSLINSQDFYKPIVTPFEIEIACTSAREWTGEYITDFQELLPGAVSYVDIENNKVEDNDGIPDISLVSGQLRKINTFSINEADTLATESVSLAKRNNDTVIATKSQTSAAEFLEQRSWKGLDPRKGETPVVKVVEGIKGIASGYNHERKSDLPLEKS